MVLQFSPWRHESELAMVRDWFFPGHVKQDGFSIPPPDMRQQAVNRVNLWLFKAGQLPAALIATAGLTEALLHDERGRAQGERSISDSAMQSIYAMAFARFVNGFVDREVARSHAAEMALDGASAGTTVVSTAKGESSMYAHAATIGMPQKFVDLRHEVTHGHIPNLIYLQQMTSQALEWLWDRWWVKKATGDPARALRELEERKRVSREAREAEELDALGAHTTRGTTVERYRAGQEHHVTMSTDELGGSP
ncbi:hypothetical protein A1O3_04900 [Capronia epimyces CBS 606.96]|uniref:Uncharacterized protein n=1 Tax=Capronia epimyces CBS 606.96 TaxID=1182542 RepID=W9XVH0_9EURO|nr:uncharacterized protein A1O3_04900 [Capronia epimyces CBS 606.96]EXJ84233.1 hypothetical protein A1O3_04900 [Capronia epimyces CBS 606.96]